MTNRTMTRRDFGSKVITVSAAAAGRPAITARAIGVAPAHLARSRQN